MELTKENYFSPEAEAIYMGSSSFKAWDNQHKGFEIFGNFVEGGCEAREVAVLAGEYEKPDKKAFLIGSYVDAWFEGPESFQEFCNENHDKIYKKRGGGVYADFERADKMIEVLRNSELIQDMRNCDRQVILTGEIAGQKIKVAYDLIDHNRKYFADLKTTDKIDATKYVNGKWVTFIDAFDYELQLAIYSEVLFQNYGEYYDMYIIVVDKKLNPDHEVIYMGNQSHEESFVHMKLEEIDCKMPHIQDVRAGKVEPVGCGKCAYCMSNKKLDKPVSYADFKERLGVV